MRRPLVGTVGALVGAALLVPVSAASADDTTPTARDATSSMSLEPVAGAKRHAARVRTSAAGATPGPVRNLSAAWENASDEIWVSWDDPVDTDLDEVATVELSVDGDLLGTLEYDGGAVISGAPAGRYVIGIALVSVSGAVGPRTEIPVVVGSAPVNDDFAQRLPLVGDWGSVWGTTWEATEEPADPSLEAAWPGSGGASIWYRWTAPRSGWTALRADTLDWDMDDPAIGVFTGTTLSGLRPVPRSEAYWWQERSRFFFSATAGTTYVIAIDGYADRELSTGILALAWEQFDQVATTTRLAAVVSSRKVVLTATVTSAEGKPVGTVEFRDGGTALGSAPVVHGSATLTLARVRDGRHRYTATFVPEDESEVAPSTSPVRTVTLAPATVASRLTLTAPRNARAGTRPVVRVQVLRGTVPATGKVVLRVGSARVTLPLRNGAASYRPARLRPGKVRVVASYGGNATTSPSSGTAVVRVTQH